MPRNNTPKWFVSRQSYASMGEDALVVEIAGGGLDYSNPGMLVTKFSGEGEEYTDPREAAKAAIEIAQAWRKASGKEITVRYGHTGGNTMPFDEATDEEVTAWAEERYENLPKCPECGDVMGEDRWKPTDMHVDDEACCSESCADKRFAPMEDVEDDADEEDEEEATTE